MVTKAHAESAKNIPSENQRYAQHNTELLFPLHRQNRIGHTDLLLSNLHTGQPQWPTPRVALAPVLVSERVRDTLRC